MEFIKRHAMTIAIASVCLMGIAVVRDCLLDSAEAPIIEPDAGTLTRAPKPAVAPPTPPVHVSAFPTVSEPLEQAPFVAASVTPAEFEKMLEVHGLWDKQRRALIAAQEDLDPDEFLRLLHVVDAQANQAYAMILGDRLEGFVADLQKYGKEEALPMLSEIMKQYGGS